MSQAGSGEPTHARVHISAPGRKSFKPAYDAHNSRY